MSSERRHIIGMDGGVPGVPARARIIKSSSGEKPPPGAVFLTDDQVLQKIMEKANSWRPRLQMWPLTYGAGTLAGLSTVSGVVFNAYVRSKFKLRHFGRYVTYVPAAVIPCLSTALLHYALVMRPVLIGRYDCPLCLEIRSAAVQCAAGVLQPLLLSILGSSAAARQNYTVAIPPVSHGKDFLQFYTKTLNKIGGRVVGLLALNAIVAMFITQELGKKSILLQEAVIDDL